MRLSSLCFIPSLSMKSLRVNKNIPIKNNKSICSNFIFKFDNLNFKLNMDSNNKIKVFYGQKESEMPKSSSFLDLKKEILKKEKTLVKYFSFKEVKINDKLLIINYPKFSIISDKNQFEEYKLGQYRCKRCHKYLRLSNWTCAHSNKCKALYIFTLKEKLNQTSEGGYAEINDIDDELEQSEDDIDAEIEQKINGVYNRHKQYMLNRINKILYG